MSFCLRICVVVVCVRVSLTVCEILPDLSLYPAFLIDAFQLPALFTAKNGFPSLPAAWIPTGLAVFPGTCPCGLCRGLDLGSNTLWKAPNMIPAWPWTQSSYSEDKAGKGASWQHPPILLETEICLCPLPRPPVLSPCSHPDQVFRVLASLSLGIRMDSQFSISTARPAKDLVLCVPPYLTCLHCAHSSYPYLNSDCPPFFPIPGVDTRTIFGLYSMTALGYAIGFYALDG